MRKEEVKQQLGEQLPGSLEAIRRAVSKFMKKDITTSELFDLMKAGKLLAKDILPLLGKEFADMARQGGALRYALNSLNSVQGRLNKSFKNWVYSIYQGGLLDGLRDLYKTLDQLFYYMSQGADSAIGKFLKGFLGQLENSIVFIYNNMLDLYYMLKYDFGFAGADMELLGKVAYWAAIVGSLNAVVKFMRIIFGGAMLGAIAKTTAALIGFGGAATAAGAGAGGASGKGIGGIIGKVMIVSFAAEALSALAREFLDIEDNPTKDLPPIEKQAVKSLSRSDEMWWPIKKIDEWIFGSVGRDFVDTAAIRQLDKINQIAAGAGGPRSALYTHIPPAQNVNVKITMDKNAKEIIKAEIQQRDQQQINSLIPPSARSR